MTDQTSQISAAQGAPTISRRTVLRAAAWTAPAVLVAAGTPALAASGGTPGVRLANQVTVEDDYNGIGTINSLGGAERFYGRHLHGAVDWQWTDASIGTVTGPAFPHEIIPSDDQRRKVNGGPFTDEELHKDFRYRIRVENTGDTTLTEVRISFSVDISGWGLGRLLDNEDEEGRTVFDLTDPADSAGGAFGGVWNYEWADSGSTANVTLILSGAEIPPGGWVQISPRWWALWDDLFISQGNGNPVPSPGHYQWNSVITVDATDEYNETVADSQETGNSGGGLWQFDGGRALNYGDKRWDAP